MTRITVGWLAPALGMTMCLAAAEEFPLEFRTVPAKEVMAFPGGSGISAMLRPAKAAGIKREPKAASPQALYGEWRTGAGKTLCVFRLDESEGKGKGYDRLIVDANRNGDLTDDPVVGRVPLPTDRRPTSSATTESALFGPIELAVEGLFPGARPVYHAQLHVYNRAAISGLRSANGQMLALLIGQLRLKAGWYLDTTVEVAGAKVKMGVYDGDASLSLGEAAQPQLYKSSAQTNWFFRPGDSLLVDADGSGAFESDPFQAEAAPFGPLLYTGARPLRVELGPQCRSLRVEPWTQPLAEVTLEPRGNEVRNVSLGWQQADGNWQLLRAGAAGGKILVPPGQYRFYACTLLGESPGRQPVMVSGSQRLFQEPLRFHAGTPAQLRCGGPLEIELTADKRSATTSIPPKTASDSDFVLRIGARVVGAAGEVYSVFGTGQQFREDPPKPVFTVTDAKGKRLANGNLEFG